MLQSLDANYPASRRRWSRWHLDPRTWRWWGQVFDKFLTHVTTSLTSLWRRCDEVRFRVDGQAVYLYTPFVTSFVLARRHNLIGRAPLASLPVVTSSLSQIQDQRPRCVARRPRLSAAGRRLRGGRPSSALVCPVSAWRLHVTHGYGPWQRTYYCRTTTDWTLGWIRAQYSTQLGWFNWHQGDLLS